MKIAKSKSPRLAPSIPGRPVVTYRGTDFNTIVLRDEYRTVEMVALGKFVGAWTGSCVECNIPSWIRAAGVHAYSKLAIR